MAYREPDAIMKARCIKCPCIFPISVYMDDRGQIIDDPLDYADFWLHHWTHEVSA